MNQLKRIAIGIALISSLAMIKGGMASANALPITPAAPTSGLGSQADPIVVQPTSPGSNTFNLNKPNADMPPDLCIMAALTPIKAKLPVFKDTMGHVRIAGYYIIGAMSIHCSPVNLPGYLVGYVQHARTYNIANGPYANDNDSDTYAAFSARPGGGYLHKYSMYHLCISGTNSWAYRSSMFSAEVLYDGVWEELANPPKSIGHPFVC